MSTEESKGPGYFYSLKPDPSVPKSHATRTAEGNCQYMLPTLVGIAERKPNLRLLDVGCGPGSITSSLARFVPDATVVGVDLSEAVLEKAREYIKEQKVDNVSFQIADVYKLPFDDESFDVIHTHQAVAHFHDHVKAIKELIRVTRKGGIICMREGDLHTVRFYPDSPLLDECFKSISAVHEKQAGTADAGRRLKAWTVEAGIPRERIVATAGTWCYDTPESRRAFDGGRIFKGTVGDKAVELGIIPRERIQEYSDAWKVWEEDQDGLMMLMHGEVIAKV